MIVYDIISFKQLLGSWGLAADNFFYLLMSYPIPANGTFALLLS